MNGRAKPVLTTTKNSDLHVRFSLCRGRISGTKMRDEEDYPGRCECGHLTLATVGLKQKHGDEMSKAAGR